MLEQQITDDMKQAMRDGDKLKLGAIRMFRAALKDKQIELGKPLTEEDVVGMAAKMIKQRKDAASQYHEAGREDLAAKELDEIKVFEVYMPEQLSEEEVAKAVVQAIADSGAESMKDMGKVMGIIRPKLQGKADMGMVSAMIKQQLQG
ncbi:MAG TPA: GatB/YqeY domain-containing protein [Mariprofundaceae bacterium]|nr:GatB/YqeY domain-containing protein [Mariprofundaceae bacterium]